jgi:hypothetical protein
MGSGGSLATSPRNYSLPALSSSTARKVTPLMYTRSVIAIFMHLSHRLKCTASTRDEMAAKPPLMREKSMHLRSRSLCICHWDRMHHE